MQKRAQIVPQPCSTGLDAANTLRHGSWAPRERLETGPGTLGNGSRPLLARLGSPPISPGAAFGRPRAVRSASRHVLETALSVPNGPKANFRRFFIDFGRFSIDFRSIFRPRSLDLRTNFARCLLLLRCFFADRDRWAKRKSKNAQVSRLSCVWPFELDKTIFTIHHLSSEATLYAFDQTNPT